jgi:hypothetical protein
VREESDKKEKRARAREKRVREESDKRKQERRAREERTRAR